jgi:hypothetical protein
MKELDIFIKRLKKIGIEITLIGNFPWIYLDAVNGNKVTEKFFGNHGFTIAFHPITVDQEFKFTDVTHILKIIRKYK